MERYRFLMSGSGGQGVITMAIILAEAAVIYEGRTAIQSQSYGPEARGGATRSDVIVADGPIFFPKVLHPNCLVALTSEASNKYLHLIRPGGLFVYDSDLVQFDVRVDMRRKGLPMHRAVMETLGKPQTFNICVLGALAVLTEAVTLESLEKVLMTRFAEVHHKNNRTALQLGADMAAALVEN
ncbi:MAG: 2-oxoacid:acceptor oxidoreductase family protein [Desulfovibrio sp.]|nr:2-oxoacid:acceptor oxidoreductase family protein [Desulfovibrio sp.]